MPRLFTALEIPKNVAQTLSMLRGGLPGARWIDSENYHVTLRFIGDVDDSVAHEVESMLGRVRRQPLELRLDGITAFGSKIPRAIVATVAPSQALMETQAEQERMMQRIGLEPEGRKYIPHVTLARLRDASNRDVADYLAGRGYFPSMSFTATQFVLFSSRASTGGGPYIVEASYPLAAKAA
jgi:RNA 2',3'-cyclic 3'-phosphodiesterase